LRFFASCQSCAARAAETTIHTGWHGSFAAVSVFTRRSATRFDQPGTTGPDLHRFGPAALLGFLHPSQYSSPADPDVCFRRSSPHAVCRSFNTAAFYGCRPSCLNSFQASRARYGQPSNDRIRLLGFVPQASQTDRIERCAGQSCRGFQRSSLRFSDVKENQGTIPTARIRNARLTTAGQRYSVALHHAV
jgi:hypothetical protein